MHAFVHLSASEWSDVILIHTYVVPTTLLFNLCVKYKKVASCDLPFKPLHPVVAVGTIAEKPGKKNTALPIMVVTEWLVVSEMLFLYLLLKVKLTWFQSSVLYCVNIPYSTY